MEFENAQFLDAVAETSSAAVASATTTNIAKDHNVAEHMQSGSGRLLVNDNETTTNTAGTQSAANATLEDKQNHPKMQRQTMSDDERNATKRSLVILAAIFTASLFAMVYVYMIFPELNESEKAHIKIPRDIQDAKMLAKVLDRYKDMYYFEVMFGVITAYVFLQTFAIPGSLFLSILLGFLYKFPIALFLICFCSSLGATLCYSLSNLVGRRLIRHFWPKKTNEWSKHVEKHRDSLFNYMLFLRMTPILPNWFINLASPVIGVPVYTFAVGTFFGVAPPSIVAIQAGKTLQKMTSSSDAFSWTSMALLSACALVSLLPGLLKNKLKKKLE
ncbi:transmembrane protein 41 homolog [Ceratitis capitata]|uniref:Transmembrane protein 41 n=1 Tax=Ceratitis capitata TaxID=7213 RepID=W8AZX4_CERCA|nr:transmembrane protein 41 homolog [Ceratitis capitata]